MWDSVAQELRQRLRADPALAARGQPQRRKGIDCRRRWDHVLKKAQGTEKADLSGEQIKWLIQFEQQKRLLSNAPEPTNPRLAKHRRSKHGKSRRTENKKKREGMMQPIAEEERPIAAV